jgi:hypothetical protein
VSPLENQLPLWSCLKQQLFKEDRMASEKQRAAARKNIKKAIGASKKKRTIAHLPKKTRTALGKQANKVKRQKAGKKS